MFYEIYGRVLKSDIEFPQLLFARAGESWDIEILVQKIPSDIMSTIKKQGGPAGQGEGFFWFNTPVGHIVIVGNNRIITECSEEEDLKVMRTYILGYGLSMIFYNRDIMAVHCSAVVKNGKGLFISGVSGAGKSTLAGRFLGNDWKLLADDVAMLEMFGDGVTSYPAYPQRKLCRDAVVRGGLDIDELTYIDGDKDKFAVACKEDFSYESAVVQAMVVLYPWEGEDVKLEEVSGNEKIQLFVQNLFLHVYFKNSGMVPEKFFRCVQMLAKIKVFRLYRPINGGDSSEMMMREILEYL